MTPQFQAFYLFLAIAVMVVAVFVWVVVSTRQAREVDVKAAYRLRRRFFFVLAALLVVAMGLTMSHMPYPRASQRPDRVVYVVGKQFAWGISDQPIRSDKEWEQATYSGPVQIPVGELVEFRVTSFDVNHGFGIYSPSGELLGQAQAMPGYVNRLRVRFGEPGSYNMFCLELCGMG